MVRLEVIDGANYLPILDTLNAFGRISGWEEKRNSLLIWFGGVELQLKTGDKKVKVDQGARTLLRPVRVSNGQWMVPVDFLTSVLPDVTHQRVAYQIGDKRAFIGDIKPISFTTRIEPIADGARLTVQFTGPVTVRTASRNGKWVVFLGDRLVAPGFPLRFQNPYLSELQFDDQDGAPKLILTPAADGLNFYPTQTAGTTFTAEIAKPASKLAQLPPAAAPRAPELPAPQPAPAPLPVVVLDAGHGGHDPGARSHDGLLEKDLVAALGERVRLALLATNKCRVVVTRSGDANPGFDERAAVANSAHAVAFLSLHAGNLGAKIPRLAVYTYVSSSSAIASGGAESRAAVVRSSAPGGRSIFVPWAELQQSHVARSRQLAQALELQFAKVPGLTTGDPVEAPVRALRNVDAPAAAIEIGSFSPDVDARPLTGAAFEDQIAAAIVHAVEGFLGGQS